MPDCDKCQTGQEYINYCEKSISSLQEKVSQLKAQNKSQTTCLSQRDVKKATIKPMCDPVSAETPVANQVLNNSKTPDSKRNKVMLISSSMGRGVSKLISDQSGNKCYGSVNPSATADYLSENINNIIGDEQPEIVCLMAGTNNIGNGERPKSVIGKIDNLVSAMMNKCPDAKVIVYHNAIMSSNREPRLKKDGLHLNMTGKKLIAKNMLLLLISVTNLFFTTVT